MRALFLCSLLLAAGCSSNENPAAVPSSMDPPGRGPNSNARPSSGDAPEVLLFGSNIDLIRTNDTVIFTAVVTDPDGIDSVIGGVLETPDGAHQYGAFATSAQEGAYEFALSWSAINRVSSVDVAEDGVRAFQARFFDDAGNSTTISRTLELTCTAPWHSRDGAVCLAPESEGSLNLAGGSHDEGRLEYFHEGQWGAVCDDDVGSTAATVACRQLGFERGTVISNIFGFAPIIVDGISCRGNETALGQCNFEFGPGDCNDSEAVAIRCFF